MIHFRNVLQPDYALCGQDIAGDSIDDRGIYENAEITKEKVTCPDCIAIVQYCKTIKKSEYINIKDK